VNTKTGQFYQKVSLIIVTYNAARTLQACLNSIYSQTYPDIEIIVMDGNSKDGTVQILENNTDKITYWKSEKDSGIYHAMNKALEHVSGEWVSFLGADDELEEGFSEMARELKDPYGIYYGNVIYKGKKCSGKLEPYQQAKLGIFHQAIIYPSEVFKKYLYNTKYKVFADYALNMTCFGDTKFKFIYKDFIIAKYNDTGVSSNVMDPAFEEDKAKLISRNFGVDVFLRYMFRKLKGKIMKAFYL
jgi:glycosyltransferase involved in cell wall biosynthesis